MSPSPLIIAHRGASAHAPENTVAAFNSAVDAGADGVEFDVRLSSDGVPVVIHDRTLQRVGGRADRVSALTADELSKIDVGSWFNQGWPDRARAEFAEESVPSLERLLEILSDFAGLVYVELKIDGDRPLPFVGAVVEIIRSSPLLSRMIVKSFCLAAIPKVRQQLPDVQTAALFEPSVMNMLRKRRHIMSLARDVGAHQLSLHTSLAGKKLVAHAHDASMPVTVWTADREKWLERCRKRGIRALITNDPQKMLAARGDQESRLVMPMPSSFS